MSKNVIIIPTYNEVSNVPILIKKIFNLLPEAEVMIIDDNSPDGTAKEVEVLQKHNPNLFLIKREAKDGLGRAYITGFEEVFKKSDYQRVIMMDGDLSHNPKFLPKILNLSESYDLVIGSRYVKDGGITKKWGLLRKILSTGGNFYLKIMFRKNINDWTTGYNAIRTDALRKLDLSILGSRGYAFISSLKYYLLRTGARHVETPIFFEERRGGESKMSWSIIWEGFTSPWKIIIREFFR